MPIGLYCWQKITHPFDSERSEILPVIFPTVDCSDSFRCYAGDSRAASRPFAKNGSPEYCWLAQTAAAERVNKLSFSVSKPSVCVLGIPGVMNKVENGPTVSELVDRLRGRTLDPVPHFLLLRDVVGLQAEDRELKSAAKASLASKWIRVLVSAQWSDGSWGRLHSADTSSAQPVPTTEIGVERGVSLGLGADSPTVMAASKYLEAVLQGETEIRDPQEKNDRWPLGVELFAASTLARIKPASKALDQVWEKWMAIAIHSVQSGRYDAKAELEAYRKLTGVSVEGSYLRLSSKYALMLLGSRSSELTTVAEQSLFDWIWKKESGIGYYGEKVSEPPRSCNPGAVERWLRSHEILSLFPSWSRASAEIVDWLWRCRAPDGLFDLGPRSRTSVVLPYSENWRRVGSRQTDWSVRILSLLQKAASTGAAYGLTTRWNGLGMLR